MKIKLNVLIIEDSEDDALLLVHLLIKGGYDVEFVRAATLHACEKAFTEKKWDIVIADYSLPGFSGMKALELFRQIGLDIPFIIVSGKIGEDIAVNAMKSGAHDYIMKDNLKRLLPAIERELREAEIRKEGKKAASALIESEASYRTIFENGGNSLAVIKDDLTIVMVNKEFEKLSGFAKEEIEGKIKWVSLVSNEEDLKNIKEFHDLCRINMVSQTYETSIIGKNKEIKNVFLTEAMIPGTNRSLIALLDFTEKKKTEQTLLATLKEKEILLHELNHRINNNLQMISNLLRIQQRNMKDKDAIAAFQETQNRIRTIALVHEKLYLVKGLSCISFKDYVFALANNIVHSYTSQENQIILKIDVDDFLMDFEIIITCGLIINELLSNSLKYAFPEKKRDAKISISFHEKEKQTFELIFSDNGIGLVNSIEIHNADTLGLRLICTLVEQQLKGSIELDQNNRNSFHILFKYKPEGYCL